MPVKNNMRRNLSVLLVFLVLASVFIVGSRDFSIGDLDGDSVWLPQYLSAECVPLQNNLREVDIGDFGTRGEYFGCVTGDAGSYVPLGTQCTFEVDPTFQFRAYDCPSDGSDLGDCERLRSFASFSQDRTFSVLQGDYLYLESSVGSPDLTARYPSYGLQIRTVQGQLLSTTTNCLLNSLGSDYHSVDAPSVVALDSPFNAVGGLSSEISTGVVSIDGVAGGRVIWVDSPGHYYVVKTADDGYRYVDTRESGVSDTRIECIPLTTGCSADARIVDLEEQGCSSLGGSIVGYAPVSGDSSQLCKYDCVAGQNVVTSDCIKVQSCSDPELPVWDSKTGDCVKVIPNEDDVDDSELLLILFIIVGFFILLIIGILFAQAKNKGGKK